MRNWLSALQASCHCNPTTSASSGSMGEPFRSSVVRDGCNLSPFKINLIHICNLFATDPLPKLAVHSPHTEPLMTEPASMWGTQTLPHQGWLTQAGSATDSILVFKSGTQILRIWLWPCFLATPYSQGCHDYFSTRYEWKQRKLVCRARRVGWVHEEMEGNKKTKERQVWLW